MKAVVALIVLIILGIGFFYVRRNGTLPFIGQISSVPTPTAAVSTLTPIPSDWKTFTSSQYGFTISYPADLTQETTMEGERFFKLGPTQSLGTELYDGIAVFVKSAKLENTTLQAFVESQHAISKNEPIVDNVTDVTPITIAGLTGWTYSISAIGDFRFIFLPKGDSEYLEIRDSTVEPQNREQTFATTVTNMLNTITF